MPAWWCSPEEAEQAYYDQRSTCNSMRNAYENARSRRGALENQCGQCRGAISSCRSQKHDFELRLKELQQIVARLESSADQSPNGAADHANNTARVTTELYMMSVRCSSTPNNNIYNAFKRPSVTDNDHSNRALTLLRNEAQRLEEAIRQINQQIAQLEQEAQRLTQEAEAVSGEMSRCLSRIDECVYSMRHYASIAWP